MVIVTDDMRNGLHYVGLRVNMVSDSIIATSFYCNIVYLRYAYLFDGVPFDDAYNLLKEKVPLI